MTSAGVVARALIEEHSDFLRESVVMIAPRSWRPRSSARSGARRGEVSGGALDPPKRP